MDKNLEAYAEYLRRTLNDALEKIADLKVEAEEREKRMAQMRDKLAYYTALDVGPRLEKKKIAELLRVNADLKLKIEAGEKLVSEQRKEISKLKAENQRAARRQVTSTLSPVEQTPILPLGRNHVSARI